MKKKTIFLLILILFLTIGCIMAKHKESIREGLLVTGLNREAFLKEWGMPDKTHTIPSEEFASFTASWGHGSYGGSGRGIFFRGRVSLDVWVYEKWDITLIFHGLRLVAWKTDKSREELKAISK